MKLKQLAKKVRNKIYIAIPKKDVNFYSCNVCGWTGNRFDSDGWHKHSRCPHCGSDVRQRLFVACLENTKDLGINLSLKGKRILHFAPEASISKLITDLTDNYKTADFLREDCDIRLDMCDMKEIASSSFDIVIAFDVLEHVPNYNTALMEIHRILSDDIGIAILSVPQRDNLPHTYEDPTITDPKDREDAYGQWDHLRIFGDNFGDEVAKEGFQVTEISWKSFNDMTSLRHTLKHPIPSPHINATNNRRIYICSKIESSVD
jgi:SAM-dependent methyltransferase